MANVAKEKIIAALTQLDPNNPEHWTDDGLPVTKVVQTLASDLNIKRSDITEVAPGFSRETAQAALDPAPPADAPVADAAPADTGPTMDPITGVMTRDPNAETVDYGDDLRAELTAKFEDATALVEQLAKEVYAKQKEHVAAIKAKDALMLDINRKFPPKSAAENIQDYLASEHRKREIAAGVVPASQLDRAMAGRRAPLGWSSNVRQRGKMVAPAA